MPTQCAIGLDVGGTKIAGGLVIPATGQVVTRYSLPTQPERGGDAVLADAIELAFQLRREADDLGAEVLSIGIGICELVDPDGNVTSGYTVQWQGLDIQKQFSAVAPNVTVEADVRAHALAEATHGAGRDYKQFVFVSVGTGISSCLVQYGAPYAGARGNALVLATQPVLIACDACGNTRQPSLEEFASGPALAARYEVLTGKPTVRAEDVIEAANNDDADARTIVESAGQALGVSLGWLVNVLDPEAIVVGGGLGSAGGLYWESLMASTRNHVWAEASRSLPIVTAQLGADAGLIGAALAGAVGAKEISFAGTP